MDGAGHQGPRWNGRVRGASWEGEGGGRSKPKPSVGRLQGEGQERVIRNGEKTDVGKKKIRDKGGERETKR